MNSVHNDSFRVIRLGEPGTPMDLPGINLPLLFAELAEQRHVIIYSERGHDNKTFYQNYRDYLTNQHQHWLSVQAEIWDEAVFDYSGKGSMPDDGESRNAQTLEKITDFSSSRAAIESLGKAPNLVARLEALDKLEAWLITQNIARFYLIIRNWDALPYATAVEIASALRHHCDKHPHSALSVLSFSATYAPFADRHNASGYAPLTYQYRLANWDTSIIQERASTLSLDLSKEALHRLLEDTGGQPLLVETLLQRLHVLYGATAAIGVHQVAEAMRRLRTSPPPACDAWLEHLRKMLQETPDLRYRLHGYVRGETLGKARFPPPLEEKEPYVGGWLSQDSNNKRWGITSRLHIYLISNSGILN